MVLEYGDIDLARLLAKHEQARREGGGADELDENFIRLYWQQMLQVCLFLASQSSVSSGTHTRICTYMYTWLAAYTYSIYIYIYTYIYMQHTTAEPCCVAVSMPHHACNTAYSSWAWTIMKGWGKKGREGALRVGVTLGRSGGGVSCALRGIGSQAPRHGGASQLTALASTATGSQCTQRMHTPLTPLA